MIADELAQRLLIHLVQYIAKLLVIGAATREGVA
jgi:hypothetical protein